MTCTKCSGLLVRDDLREDPDVIPCLRCVMCGKYYFEMASVEELAVKAHTRREVRDILGVSHQAVQQREHKALKKLRIAAQKLGITKEDCY